MVSVYKKQLFVVPVKFGFQHLALFEIGLFLHKKFTSLEEEVELSNLRDSGFKSRISFPERFFRRLDFSPNTFLRIPIARICK